MIKSNDIEYEKISVVLGVVGGECGVVCATGEEDAECGLELQGGGDGTENLEPLQHGVAGLLYRPV